MQRFLLAALLVAFCAAAQAQDESARRNAHLAFQKGFAHHFMGRYDRAVELYRESIAAAPSPEAHTFLGWSLSHLGRFEEAIAECRKAIALDPEFGNPYNDIGVYLIQLGRKHEAEPWFHKAISATRYCCYQFPLTHLGRLRLEEGRLEEARRWFLLALHLVPNYAPALEGLEATKRDAR
jgi:tetratricopeptide (TPR) repeat protein